MRRVLTSILVLAAVLAAGLVRAAEEPGLDFRSDAFTYVEPGRPCTLNVYGHGISSATIRLFPLPDLAGTLEEARRLPRGKAVRTLPVKIRQEDRYFSEQPVKIQPLPEGVYLAELESASGRDQMVLVVTRLLLVSKVAA